MIVSSWRTSNSADRCISDEWWSSILCEYFLRELRIQPNVILQVDHFLLWINIYSSTADGMHASIQIHKIHSLWSTIQMKTITPSPLRDAFVIDRLRTCPANKRFRLPHGPSAKTSITITNARLNLLVRTIMTSDIARKFAAQTVNYFAGLSVAVNADK